MAAFKGEFLPLRQFAWRYVVHINMNGPVFHEGQQDFETESVFSDYIEYFFFSSLNSSDRTRDWGNLQNVVAVRHAVKDFF